MRACCAAVAVSVGIFSIASPAGRAHNSLTPAASSGWEWDPAWTADGHRLAFVSDSAGSVDVWVRDVESGQTHRATSHPADDTQPSWSPAGDCLTFRSERDGGGIYIACDGAADRRLTGDGDAPRWSSDGSRVLFVISREGASRVQVVKPSDASAPPVPVAPALTSKLRGPVGARWVRGDRIAIFGTHETLGTGVWMIEPGAADQTVGAPIRLGRAFDRVGALRVGDLEFSGDGTWLGTSAARQTGAPFWYRMLVNPATLSRRGDPELIGTWPGAGLTFALSDSPLRIAASSHVPSTQIWVFPFDAATGAFGSDAPLRVGTAEGQSLMPDLSPDGRRLGVHTRPAAWSDPVAARVSGRSHRHAADG